MVAEEKLAYRWYMLLWILLVSLFVTGVGMAVMPALFDEIADELDLNHVRIGIIWGAAALGGLLTSLIGGALGDRFGAKRLIAVGIVIATVSCALRAVLPGFWGLTAAMLFFGMSMGFIYPSMTKAVSMWFGPEELGLALGAIIVGGASGFGIGVMGGAVFSSLLGGWKAVMWLTAAISLGALIMWMALARERPATASDHATQGVSIREGVKSVIGIKDLWFVAVMELCVGGAAMAAVGLLPETLSDRGLSVNMAGVYVGISTFVVMAFNIIGPYFSDRAGLRKPFIWPFVFISAGAVTFFGVFMGAALIIMIVLYSVGLGVSLPLFMAAIVENDRIGSRLAGSALGVMGTVASIGPMFMPVLMGAIMDATGEYWPGFLLLAVLLAAGAVMGIVIKETGLRAKKATSSLA